MRSVPTASVCATGIVSAPRPTIDVLRDLSPTARVRAVEANLTEFHVFGWPEITLHRDDDRIWTLSQRRFSLCNVVLEARFDSTDVGRQTDRAIAPYLNSRANIMWKLGPSTQPGDLGDRLVERGFIVRPTLKGMALDLAALESSWVWPPGVSSRSSPCDRDGIPGLPAAGFRGGVCGRSAASPR